MIAIFLICSVVCIVRNLVQKTNKYIDRLAGERQFSTKKAANLAAAAFLSDVVYELTNHLFSNDQMVLDRENSRHAMGQDVHRIRVGSTINIALKRNTSTVDY